MLEESVKTLAQADNFAVLTTLMPDGQPQTNLMWVDCDNDHLLLNTERHRQKFRNMERDPRATVTIWDKSNPYSYVEVRGRVVGTIGGKEARDHIDSLAQKYLQRDYDDSMITSERVMIKIAADSQHSR